MSLQTWHRRRHVSVSWDRENINPFIVRNTLKPFLFIQCSEFKVVICANYSSID